MPLLVMVLSRVMQGRMRVVYTHSCSIWLSRTSMTGLVGLELGSRILGLADFIAEAAASQDALLMRAAPSHLGRLNSIIIFIVVIIFIFFSSAAVHFVIQGCRRGSMIFEEKPPPM